MYDSDEDVPPALDTLPQQVTALQKKKPLEKSTSSTNEPDEPTTTADVVCSAKQGKKSSNAGPFRKGFLSGGKTTPPRKKTSTGGNREADEVPFLKGQSNMNGEGKSIPDMFKIPGAEEYQRFKQELTEKLKPNEDTMKEVQGNPMLVDAFSDPEVMAAVGEVARNPASFEKYKNTPKIVAFYEQFGKVLGKRLDAKEGG
ncbi:hypothetical protein BSKO_00813 [Bryopsis sp. KO-2023]|nr:hypothetical protein BSKO_00813 [Bryopsis sp. KO-2023]